MKRIAEIVLSLLLLGSAFGCVEPEEETVVQLGEIEVDSNADHYTTLGVGIVGAGETAAFEFSVAGDLQLRLEQSLITMLEHGMVSMTVHGPHGELVATVGDVGLGPDGGVEEAMPTTRPMVSLRGAQGRYSLAVQNQSEQVLRNPQVHFERPFDGDCDRYLERLIGGGRGEIVAHCRKVLESAVDDPVIEITAADVCVARIDEAGAVHGFLEWRHRETGETGRYEGELIYASNILEPSWYEGLGEQGPSGEESDRGAVKRNDGADRQVRRRYDYLTEENTLKIRRTSKFFIDAFPLWRTDAFVRLACEFGEEDSISAANEQQRQVE